MFQIGNVQTLSYRGQTTIMSFKLIVFEVALLSLPKTNQTNKCSSLALLLVSAQVLMFKTLHLTCGLTSKIQFMSSKNVRVLKDIFRTAHSTILKKLVSFMAYMFQNTTQHTHTCKLRKDRSSAHTL